MNDQIARKKISVIILTFDGSKFLDDCFNSLAKTVKGDFDLEVLVADSASADGTPATIRRRWPWVKVVELEKNFGFAGGNNRAVQLALDGDADFIYLLNQDTEVDPHFLEEAWSVMQSDPAIGAVQSLLLLHPQRDLVNSTGGVIHFLGFGYCSDYRRPVAEIDRQTVCDIAYAGGAGVLLRSAALRQVGLLDEELFAYHEDLDLGWRLRLAGYRNVLAPKSIVWHKYEFSRSITKWYYMERNRYIVLLKSLRWRSLLVIAPGLLATEIFMLFPAFKNGWWRNKLKVWRYFLTPHAWAYITRERRRVMAERKISDREAMRLFTYAIRDQDGMSPFVEHVANPLMRSVWSLMQKML